MWGNPIQSWILDSTSWILDPRYRILDSLSMECGFRIPDGSGIRIPWVVFRILKPRIPNFTSPGFQIPLHMTIAIWTKSHGPTTQIKPLLLNLAWHKLYVLSDDYTTKIWISLGIFIMATIKSGRVKLRQRSFLVTSVRDSLRRTKRIERARIKPKKCKESLRMTSCPPCWFPKTVKRRPCWCWPVFSC